MTSPTPAERAALKVAEAAAESPMCAAQGLPKTVVFALGSAGVLMDPETAAELAEYRRQFPLLRARVAELESERHTTNEALADVTAALRASDAMAPHAAPCRFPSGPDCTCMPQAVTA